MGELVTGLARPVAALILPFIIWATSQYALVWLVFLPFCGLWLEGFEPNRAYTFLYPLAELGVGGLFLAGWLAKPEPDRSPLPWILFALPFLSLPGLLNAEGHVLLSLTLFAGLVLGAGWYAFLYRNMGWILASRQVDLAVLGWTGMNVGLKFFLAGGDGGSVLYQRKGAIWGSNHFGGMMLLLLPLVRSRWVFLAVGLALLLNFSRGIYMGLAVLGLVWALLVSARAVLKGVLALGLVLTLALALAPPVWFKKVMDFAVERVAVQGMKASAVSVNQVLTRARTDQRTQIWVDAMVITRDSRWLGTGLGGFSFEMVRLGKPGFSNAHSLYFTLLSEAGPLFLAGFLGLMGYALWMALRYAKPLFAGLLSWIVYGVYSGEIYEASRFVSFGDYYYLLLVLACAVWMADQARASHGA